MIWKIQTIFQVGVSIPFFFAFMKNQEKRKIVKTINIWVLNEHFIIGLGNIGKIHFKIFQNLTI